MQIHKVGEALPFNLKQGPYKGKVVNPFIHELWSICEQLEVGGVSVTQQEWNRKSNPSNIIQKMAKNKTRGLKIFSSRTFADNSGWYIFRVR